MRLMVRPVILSGGSGTRLWPVSRKHFPKQFAALIGNETLFDGTLRTTANRERFLPPIVIGNIQHRFLMRDAFERMRIHDATILLEPSGRNTAIAALVAALADQEAHKTGQKILHLVMPSDHIIGDKAAFARAVETAMPAAEVGKIVLFGIEPTRPDTGFGYILAGEATPHAGVQMIKQFCEKPAQEVAEELVSKKALWNSGIFFYDPGALLAEAERLMPDDVALCREALAKAKQDMSGLMLDEAAYKTMGSQPFDRAIMEKTKQGAVVPCDLKWSDMGTWETLWHAENKDARQNTAIGSVVTRDTDGCYIRSYGPMTAVMGVADLMVVATKDCVLVAPRSRAQEVKELVEDVTSTNGNLALEHPCVMRPWGSYEKIAAGDRFQVKHIVVSPGQSLSRQMHHHRTEHWVVVVGTAEVECGDDKKLIFPNESIYIPGGVSHRLANPGKVDLHLIEVQSGDYLGEDDIVRFEDSYGRVKIKEA